MPEHEIEITPAVQALGVRGHDHRHQKRRHEAGRTPDLEGSAHWRPKNKRAAKTISWERVAQLMDDA
jgi:hypothetical protein